MTTETNDLAGAGSEIVAPENVETPEVTTPENSAEQQTQPEEKPSDDGDKTVKRMERRIDRLVAAREQAKAEASQLRQMLSQIQRQAQPEETQQFKPEDIEQVVEQRARQLREMDAVSARSTQIRDDLIKEVGSDSITKVLSSIVEEAGPLANEDGRWTPLGEAIADSDQPAKLLAHLGKNPELAESLQGLTPAQLGRRIARIEADMNKQPEAPKPSGAPKPLQPVKATSGSVTPGPDSPDYLAWKLKQLKG